MTELHHFEIAWAGHKIGLATAAAAQALHDNGLGQIGTRSLGLREDHDLSALLDEAHRALHAASLCSSAQGEMIDVLPAWDAAPLARCDKSLALPLGLRLDKICLHGLIAGADGAPAGVWLARRARDTAFAPHHLDSMVVGGRMAGDSLSQTMVHEAQEEAGLPSDAVACIPFIERIEVRIPSARGLRVERYHVGDLVLDHGFTPVCEDGEIEAFERYAIHDLGALLDGGERLKPGIEPVLRSAIARWGQ